MNVQKILTTISDEECIVLSGEHGSVCIDNTDKVEVINGQEFVHIKSVDGTFPVPTDEFDDATVMSQMDFVMHCIFGL